jgi:hypothetical protein
VLAGGGIGPLAGRALAEERAVEAHVETAPLLLWTSPTREGVDGARASILGFESRDRRQACSRARGVRPRVTVIQEGRDTTVREIETAGSNPARSANTAHADSLSVC